MNVDAWLAESQRMQSFLEQAFQSLLQGSGASGRSPDFMERVQLLRRTQIEREVSQAMGKLVFYLYRKNISYSKFTFSALTSEKILAVFRERAAQCSKGDVEAAERLRKIKDELTMNLSTDNHTTLV